MEDKYDGSYSEDSFFDKIKECAKKAGVKVIYMGLILFYTLQKPSTPVWAKTVIIGALGYFIVPLDAIPDFTPVVGYGDDLGALAAAIGTVAMHIDSDVKQNAKVKLKDWFGDIDENELEY